MKKLLLSLFVALFLGNLAVAQFKVVGYQPYWRPTDGIQYNKLTHINYAFALPQYDGRLKPLSNPGVLQQIVANAHAVGGKVFIAIGGWSDNGAMLDPVFESLASTPQGRTNLVNDALALVQAYNLDGVDMDWEFPDAGQSATNFELLMRQLADALHARGKQLSAAISAALYYGPGINSATFSFIDFYNVMVYDNDQEANHSSYNYAQQSINYWVNQRGMPKSKYILGVPFYARPSWRAYRDLLAAGASPNSDQFGSDYYNGIPTIQRKTELAWNQAGGIMIWELSQDQPGANSLLTAIDNKVKSLGGSNQLPNVSLTAPSNGASYTAPASITISANASDPDGTISKVEFYQGSSLIGTDNTSPYSITWTNVGAGNYSITAKATDNKNGTRTSGAVSVSVTNPVTQSPYGGSPANIPGKIEAENYDFGGQGVAYNDNSTGNSGNAYRPTENVDIEATGDVGGGHNVGWTAAGEWTEYTVNVTKTSTYKIELRMGAITTGRTLRVEFNGVDKTGTVASNNTGAWTAFQTVTVNNVSLSAGTQVMRVYHITGDLNLNFINVVEQTTGNNPPSVSISSPSNGASFTAPANITINANASDDVSVSRVEFYNGSTLLGSDNTSPYSFTWSGVGAGSYSITARAFDGAGLSTTSAGVNVSVSSANNQAPSVSITSPSNGASFTAPATVTINANASDNDGVISRVEFYRGTTLLGTDNASPFSYSWTNVAAGSYAITAKAFDNAGASATSAVVNITVNNSTGGCSGIPQYTEGGSYSAGSKVQNAGSQYECKPWPYSGWCSGAAWAYGPGTGAYWQDAWILKGSCAAKTSASSIDYSIEGIAPNPANDVASVELTIISEMAGAESLTVVSSTGMVVTTEKVMLNNGENTLKVDVANLSKGIYMLKVGEKTFKFVKN